MKTPRQINVERKKDGLPPLNFPLFRKVIKKLTVAPMAYEQGDTAFADSDSPCGTAACLGGWADILSGLGSPKQVSLDRAGNALGLNGERWGLEYETERAILFDGTPGRHWPAPYRAQWQKAKTRPAQARVAIRYLTHIITTGKVLE